MLAQDLDAPGSFIPVRVECAVAAASAGECVELPVSIANAPGILSLPAGCEAALSEAGLTARDNLAQRDETTPWLSACRRPQRDFDSDGLGDACDFCPFGFDTTNESFVDDSGRLWPNQGAACNGDLRCQ